MNATFSSSDMKLDIDVPNDLAKRLLKMPDAKKFIVNALTSAFDERAAEAEWDTLTSTPESQAWLAQQADQVAKDYQAGDTQAMTSKQL